MSLQILERDRKLDRAASSLQVATVSGGEDVERAGGSVVTVELDNELAVIVCCGRLEPLPATVPPGVLIGPVPWKSDSVAFEPIADNLRRHAAFS